MRHLRLSRTFLLMKPGPHLHEDVIEKYSRQQISEEESATFEEHLLMCEACRERVIESDIYIPAMERAAFQIRGAPEKRPAAWAAALAALALSVVILTNRAGRLLSGTRRTPVV